MCVCASAGQAIDICRPNVLEEDTEGDLNPKPKPQTDICRPNVLEEVAEGDDSRNRKRDEVNEGSESVSSKWRGRDTRHKKLVQPLRVLVEEGRLLRRDARLEGEDKAVFPLRHRSRTHNLQQVRSQNHVMPSKFGF